MTPSFTKWSANMLAFLFTWTKLIVFKVGKWEWIRWKTCRSLQFFKSLSREVPLHIFFAALIINSKYASIITLCEFESNNISKHYSRAVSFAILFLALPKWPWNIFFIWPSSSLIAPPKPANHGFPFEAPSILIFRKSWGGGHQMSLSAFIWLIPLIKPYGLMDLRPKCSKILTSWGRGWSLGSVLNRLFTVSLSYLKIRLIMFVACLLFFWRSKCCTLSKHSK